MKHVSMVLLAIGLIGVAVFADTSIVTQDISRPQGERIWISTASASPGETVVLDVMIENPVTRIDAVTIRFTYDNEALEYVDWGDGTLDPGWVMFNLNESRPGMINLGGFCVQSAIEPGSKGSLARLSFKVKPDAKPGPAFVSFEALRDDIQSFNYENGKVEIKAKTSVTKQ